jgi:hypothetical protein
LSLIGGLSYRRLAIVIAVLIVVGGVAVAFLSQNGLIGGLSAGAGANLSPYFGSNAGAAQIAANNAYPAYLTNGGTQIGQNQVVTTTATASMTMTFASTTTAYAPPESPGGSGKANQPAGTAGKTSGSIEYFSNVTMVSSNPSVTTAKVVNIAYMQGGYVAYSSSNANFSFVVIRVPAGNFQTALSEIQSTGNVTNTARWSNDVTVQYTDLNATLSSLRSEQTSLLKILNSSTLVNNTLAIETQIQSVNRQIDETESQILQAQRLISYSSISVSITISGKSIKPGPLTLKLSETPKSGVSPLGVTFSAIVQGGVTPYVVNYNFGDGSSQQGQIVIHQYYSSGDYNATVTVTDSSGNVAMQSALIHVTNAPGQTPLAGFFGTVGNLFVSVIEGIAEVAVVVIPIGLVAFAVLIPFRRRARLQKEVKSS